MSDIPRPPWSHPWPPRGPHGPHGQAGPVDPLDLRLSDAERAEVTDVLCRHYADGRLDEGEFQERSARVAAARTRRDLAGLLDDLPPLDRPVAGPAAAGPRRPGRSPVLWLAGGLVGLWLIGGIAFGILHAVANVAFHPWIPWWLVLVIVVVALRRRDHWRHHHGHHSGPTGWPPDPSGRRDRWVA